MKKYKKLITLRGPIKNKFKIKISQAKIRISQRYKIFKLKKCKDLLVVKKKYYLKKKYMIGTNMTKLIY